MSLAITDQSKLTFVHKPVKPDAELEYYPIVEDEFWRSKFQDNPKLIGKASPWIFHDISKSSLPKQQTIYSFDGVTLPPELKSLRDIVEKSRWMLELQDNWDDEGSSAYSEKTWKRAVTFLLKNALALWQEQQIVITEPAIHNGPEGSIDIHWGSGDRKLLINIPANSDESTNFYGYNLTGGEVRGTLNLSDSNKWLLLWQME